MNNVWIKNCARRNSTDEELVRLFLDSRDNRHFQALYERYKFKVYQRVFALVHDAARAEDITHDVFLKLYSKMNTFKKGAKFSTWLFSIIYNHCVDLTRTSARRIVLVFGQQVDLQVEMDLCVLFGIDGIDIAHLKALLGELDVEERALLYLKYIDSRSLRDLASMFRTTESAVKMRLLRSRRKLRKRYTETFIGE